MLRTAVLTIAALYSSSASAQVKVYPEWSAHQGIAFSRITDEKTKTLEVYDVVSAWQLAGRPRLAHCDKWKTPLKGVFWCFASERNMQLFKDATESDGSNTYLPDLGGHCALGTSWGYPGPKGDPRTARIYTNERGEKVLVLQSAPKWVPVFEQHGWKSKYRVALAAFNVLKASGVIVPNDKAPLEASTK